MSFKCNECGESVSTSKMAGIAFGYLSRSVLEKNKILDPSSLSQAFNRGDFAAGALSGFGVPCPKCKKSNWS